EGTTRARGPNATLTRSVGPAWPPGRPAWAPATGGLGHGSFQDPAHVLRLGAGDAEALGAAGLPAGQLDLRLRHAEELGQEGAGRGVGPAAFRGGGNADLQRVAVAARHRGAARPRLHVNAQQDGVLAVRLGSGRLNLEQILDHARLL